MKYLAYKIIESFCCPLDYNHLLTDVLVIGGVEITLYMATNIPNIPVNIKVISNDSRKTLFNKFIGRKQALIIPSLELGSYELVITPTVNKKIMLRSSATAYCQGDCSGPDLEKKGFPVSKHLFEIENDTNLMRLEVSNWPSPSVDNFL